MTEQNTVHRYVPISEIDDLRDAAHASNKQLGRQLRDEAILVLLADLGLRVNELVQLKRSMFRLEQGELMLPADIQKDYPTEQSPKSATMRLDPYGHFNTVRLLRSYFSSSWYQSQESDYVFPSRQSEQMTTESVRNVVERLAVEGDVQPRRTDGEPADASEIHPHALRHSVANYMLADEDTRLVDVRNRLRHRSISTTERVYEHFQRR
jgi:integrase/recombinase XerC/integrase/recombinase XerD